MIGDPSGRATERAMLTTDEVLANVERISGQLRRFLDFSPGPTQALLINNLEWTAPLSAIDFLRDVGKHFPINAMLDKDSVRNRLDGGGLTFAEFSYQLLQANDYLELLRRYDCRLQIGGSDQWGNITAGLDFIRRVTGESAHGLTVPLVTNANGEKFGKSTGGGRVWLDPELTSPYAFYQFFLNSDDRDVITYLRLFTDLSQDEIDELEAEVRERPQARAAQRRLAADFTALLHGQRRGRAGDRCVRGPVRTRRPGRPAAGNAGGSRGRDPRTWKFTRARAGGGAGHRGRAGGDRALHVAFGRPAGDRAGRRLPQQRQGRRRRVPSSPRQTCWGIDRAAAAGKAAPCCRPGCLSWLLPPSRVTRRRLAQTPPTRAAGAACRGVSRSAWQSITAKTRPGV